MEALAHKPKRIRNIDMCNGPLFSGIVRFTLPIIFTGMLQLFYNAADVIVVGRYAGQTALAAVGSTGSLINLLVNLFLGLSVGVSVCVAQGYGAHDYTAISETVHTAVLSSLFAGFFVAALGFSVARPCLALMRSPADVIDQATLYLRLYFLGIPGTMFYNFGAAIFRAIGDTRRPLLFLSVSGLVNVVLNLVFVIRFRMGVAGVALATVASQYLAALFILFSLSHAAGPYHVDMRRLRIHKARIRSIVRVGLPAGLQSFVFSLSNMLIQSSVNGFGSIVMAGSAAASNLENFVITGMDSVSQASMTFTGQNVGAGRYERLGRIHLLCILFASGIGLIFGHLIIAFGPSLLSLYNTDPAVIESGMLRLGVMCSTMFLCGAMHASVGTLRGMGESLLPMLVTMLGACVLRIIWIATVFRLLPTLPILYACYPVSWGLTALVHALCACAIRRKKFLRPASAQEF